MAWKKSKLFGKRNRRSAMSNKRHLRILCVAGFEKFESRRVLAGYFDEVATKVDGALGSVTTALHGIESLARLPLINKNIKDLSQVTDSLESFRGQLRDTLTSLSPTSAAGAIQNAIFGVLDPLHVLADKVSPSSIGPEDVVVNVVGSDVAISLNIGKSVTFSSATGLGVDSVPFQPDAREQGSDGSFTIGLTYENLNFGIKNNSPYFSTDALNELQFKIYGYLPEEMTVGLGFLVLKAKDKTPDKTPDKADLSLTFSADITSGFGISNARIGGGANLQLGLESSFPAPGLPEFKTDFVFKWNLSDSSAPLSSGWGAPELAFNNVEMNIGSFLGNLVQPLAERAQDLLEPLQPIFDLMTEPIPVIDDLSAAMDGPVIDLVFMSNTLSAYPNMPQEFFNIIKAADKLRQFSQTVDRLAGKGANHWVPLGSFNISGPSGGSLLDAPLAALGNLGLSKWSSLIFSGGKLDLQGFKSAIIAELPGGVGDEVNGLFDALTGEVAGNGLTLDFPVTRDPSGVAMAFLLGQQDSDLVTATANFNVKIDKLIDLSPIPGLIIGLRASGAFTAYAKMGYDIKGLQEAIAPLYAGNNFDASKIMDGLWIDRNTRLRGDAKVLVTGGVGLPDVVELTADGGLTTDLTITLSTNTSAEKIRPLAGELGNSLFAVNGTMDAVAQVTFKAGFELLGEWIGYDKSWPFAKYNIYKFDTSSVPVPPSMQPVPSTPPELARYDAAQRVLTLNAGADAYLRGAQLGSAKDENYTIRRLPTGGLAVSAFGYVQKFNGPFDRVDAFMDDGDDRLHVIDPSSNTFYLIDAGDGEDNVNVDGKVKVYIQGGIGNDTLDGGSGRESIDVRGGPGQNNITIGDGLLKNVDPNVSIFIDGGFFGRLKIDNTDDNIGSDYYFYDDPASLDWRLRVVSGGTTRELNFPRMVVTLRAGNGNDHFYGWFPQFANIYAGGGDDTWDITYQQPGLVPDLEYYMTYYGGPGNDKVTFDDSNGSSNFKVRTNPFGGGPTSIISWGSVARPTQVQVQGIEDTKITTNRSNGVEVDSWSDGPLTINTAYAQFNADHYVSGNTSIHLVNTPQLFFVDPSPANNQKGMGIDEFGPYLGNPLDYYQWPKNTAPQSVVAKLRIDYDEATTSVDFFGSLMTIEPSVMYSARPWNFRFVGSEDTGAYNVLKIAPPDPNNPNVASRDFDYRISNDTLTIGPMKIEARNLNSYQLIGGQGSDTITIDSLKPGVIADINGGLGEDSIIINSRLDPANLVYEIRPDAAIILDKLSVGTKGVENLQILGGTGNDIYELLGDFDRPVRIDGGGGNDLFEIGAGVETASIRAPIRIEGGEGNDTFAWNGIDNVYLDEASNFITYPVSLDGGSGYNALALYDQDRSEGAIPNYGIFADRVFVHELRSGTAFSYDNMAALDLYLSENADTVNIYSVSEDIEIGNQVSIHGNGGDDAITVFPKDAAGNDTIQGNLGIGGGAGADRLVIDNSASTLGTNYAFYNQYGPDTTNVGGVGPAGFGAGSDIEQLELRAGSGADSFRFESYLSPSTALAIAAGEGDDVLDISPTDKNAGATFNDSLPYAFDGGGGSDSFSLFNNASSMPWYYSRTGNALSVLSPGEFRLETVPLSFESWMLTGGTQRDTFYLADQASGETTSIDGAAGLDTLLLGFNGYTRNIHGQVIFDGGIDGGMLAVLDPTNTTGVTVHIEGGNEGSIGGATGDTLFGAGGSVRFRNLADDAFGDGFGLTLRLGTGTDTIFAVPNSTATTSIDAGEPSEGSGDKLYLGLNQTQNPVVQNLGVGNGRVTSSNLKPIEWYSVEQLDTEYVAPTSILVTNTLDSGPGSLRQAILDANATANASTADIIRFSIPGVGAHTIQPLSPLPFITDPVVLDATTQPGYAGKPVIELDGTLAGRSNGLVILSGGSTVRGFAINRFSELANIEFLLGGGNVIQSNYIGTNLAGNAVYPMASPTVWGVVVYGSGNNIVGTDGDGVNDEVEGNVISGHGGAGILFESGNAEQQPDNNVIAGNRIGTSADGNSVLGNGRMGLFFLFGGTGNRIGTNSDGISDSAERNIISGNPEAGIYLISADANVIAGNFIGTDAAGDGSLGNGDGIVVNASSNNRIGGIQPGAGNVIANNAYSGVILSGGSGTGNSILGNSIYNNARLGIDLRSVDDGPNFVTLNDHGDRDSGPNGLQNFPKIAHVLHTGENTIISGSLDSSPNSTFRIEFFANSENDPTGYGEGQYILGSISVTTDSTGIANFVANFSSSVGVGSFVSATATDANGNTSEFAMSSEILDGNSQPNVVAIPKLDGSGFMVLTAPEGSTLVADLIRSADLNAPNQLDFPFGILELTLTGIEPGSAADVLITGIDLHQLRNYYNFGRTSNNNTEHWYSFLLDNRKSNPVPTGMEVVDGNIVLHLIDGKKGDSDLTKNGTISSLGGAVFNRAPIARDDYVQTPEDQEVNILTVKLSRNDSDADGDRLNIIDVGGAVNGTVSLRRGMIRFVPTKDFNGIAGFDYTLSDGYTTSVGHVTVQVSEVNDAPTAKRDFATVLEDNSVVIDVSSNDLKGPANESGQTLTVKSARAEHGTVSIQSDGTLRYQPRADFYGNDLIQYTIQDNGRTNGILNPLSSKSWVVVTVTPVNDAPVAKDFSVSVSEDDSVRVQPSGSDLETPSPKLIYTITRLPLEGQLLDSKGKPWQVGDHFSDRSNIIYRPGAAREGRGTDSFVYGVTDSNGGPDALSDEGTVLIKITQAVENGRVKLSPNGVLRIGGTDSNDEILVSSADHKLRVKINGRVVVQNLSAKSVQEIRVWGRGGNDKIDVSGIDIDTLIHGGSGNDEIRGGSSANIIFGDEGNDNIRGGDKNDLLIGGLGSDTLMDAKGNDILIGGSVSSRLSDEYFRQVSRQWNAKRSSNPQFLLEQIDDRAVDTLIDGLGDDWYLMGIDDLKLDQVNSDHDLVSIIS